ncbi:hypothetical protein GCM10017557_64650 [Streptomyces aurantiacus]|uniref:Uncharacterized protein n=1 Tax=Streptomyces aurantiacus TaxID=47760 RepID=A0A7G1PCT4_9ACTN|nr:hypothetical protein GCM10017557_64650 [Streptomyces aurantiacus]
MPGRGQRDPQAGRPEGTQPPQSERESDGRRLPGQSLDPVHGVLTDDGDHRVVRRNDSGQKGISPCRQQS